jgi:2',3'-cyclic-nucleotide 2'-phosphodiesterase
MNIVFLGDVFGKPGRQVVLDNIVRLKQQYAADFLIINGENLADGKGLTEKTTKLLFDAGVTAITSGNHLWDRQESQDYLKSETRIVKPLNYPSGALGNPFYKVEISNSELTLLSITGQIFMSACNSPFSAMEEYLEQHKTDTGCILVDFHAESTAEKRAFAHMFDGRVSAILGTHTHIQTADEEILPLGTGYITDVGMTGPHDSVIGVKKHLIIEKMKTGMPIRYEVANSGLQINGVFLVVNDATAKTEKIERIRELLEN